jgi:hypothetical protein
MRGFVGGENLWILAGVSFTSRAQRVQKARSNERSLGFIPLLLMTTIYLICTVFSDAIGPLTSAPGFWRPELGSIRRGCIIPRATE